MTRRQPVSVRSIVQVVAAVVAVMVVGVVLHHLRATAPEHELEFVAPAAVDPRGEDVAGDHLEVFTCQRTLPDAEPRPRSGGQARPPIGRVRSGAVVSCPDNFDPDSAGGPPVEFVGEVVGDVLVREAGAWVLMNDDAYGLETGPLPAAGQFAGTNTGVSVWLPDTVVNTGELTAGRPGRRGDVLRVTGSIHRVDAADGGGLTLRASAASTIADAQPAPVPIHGRQVTVAGLVAAVAAAAVAYDRLRKQRH